MSTDPQKTSGDRLTLWSTDCLPMTQDDAETTDLFMAHVAVAHCTGNEVPPLTKYFHKLLKLKKHDLHILT